MAKTPDPDLGRSDRSWGCRAWQSQEQQVGQCGGATETTGDNGLGR